MKFRVIFFILLATLFAGCDSPTDNFDRVNRNDPLSPGFSGGPVTGLQASAGSSGVITIQWAESNSIVTKNVIEKSLGDTLNFTPLAELHPDNRQFVDSTLEVRKNTYYRLSSFIELEGIEDVLYGRTQAQLSFGLIVNDRFDFLEDSNSLQLSWNTDVPFYTHFIITSENVLNEQQENSVRIPAGTLENTFEDPLLDIAFETREYTITGVIEHEGVDETVVEKEITFHTKSFFSPRDLQINILNEQDWEISWDGKAFFATEVELIRRTSHEYEDVILNLPADATSYLDSLIIGNSHDYSKNQFRSYDLRFKTAQGESALTSKFDGLDILEPFISNTSPTENDPNSITIYGTGSGGDANLIKEYIIEKPHSIIPGRYVEVARVDGGNNFQFTDTNVNEFSNQTYRVRTVTSFPSLPISLLYSHDYEVEYSLYTSMSGISSVEVTSDQNYLAATSLNRFQSGSLPIYIWDLNSRQLIETIDAGSESITDFKISPDENFIYFTVPSEGAIYKADFPSGNNKVKIIDDAFFGLHGTIHIDVSSDGTFLVGTGGTGFVKRWNLDTYDSVFLFSEYSNPTTYLYKNVAISPNGALVGGNNGASLILDAENGSIVEVISGAANMVDLQFSSDGAYYANVSGFQSVSIFSTDTWEIIDHTAARRATFHPENSTLALSGYNNVFIYDPIEKRTLDVISDQNGRAARNNIQDKITFIDNDRLAIINNGVWIEVWKKTTTQRWKSYD